MKMMTFEAVNFCLFFVFFEESFHSSEPVFIVMMDGCLGVFVWIDLFVCNL